MKLLKYIALFFLSMLPVIELRGAIPLGVVWFGKEMSAMLATYIISVVGNCVPVPFILLFVRRAIPWMQRTKALGWLGRWLERKANRNKDKIIKTNTEETEQVASTDDLSESVSDGVCVVVATAVESKLEENGAKDAIRSWSAAIALCLFVGIPLPGTGAWTGALVAAFFGMKKRYAFPAIFIGVLLAGVIMTLGSYGVVSAFEFFTKI